MEPIIKSEPCEKLYSENEKSSQHSRENNVPQSQNNLKRLYEEIEDSSTISENVNQYNPNISMYQTYEFPGMPQHFQQSFNTQDTQKQTHVKLDGNQFKKFKANVLFNPPFFNLVEELSHAGAISARCYGCGKVVKGNRGISSNFIKHMKRSHPETYKLYDDYKAQKTKTFYSPNQPEMVTKKPATNVENGVSGSDSTTANSNDDTNQCFETRAVLEAYSLNDSSEDNENSVTAVNEVTNGNFSFSPQNLQVLGRIIDEKLKNALTNTNKVHEVNLDSAITELKTELQSIKKECSELRLAVQKSEASKRQLKHELQTVDKLLHQRKLIIRNISVCDPENPLKSVETLLRDVLLLEDIKIAHCCIIPSANTYKMSNKETVSIELSRPQDSKAILRQTQKLKNTGIFIEMEISPFQRNRKNKLMVLRKELLRRKPDLKILVRDITLVINGKNFYWDDVEGLCHDSKPEAIELNGVEYLKTLTGLDLKEFISFLLNYNVLTT